MTMTSEAMMVSWTMIRMFVGIMFRSRLTDRLESAITATTAALITTEVCIPVVTARAEQIPSTWSAIGLLWMSGSIRIRRVSVAIS